MAASLPKTLRDVQMQRRNATAADADYFCICRFRPKSGSDPGRAQSSRAHTVKFSRNS